jgi:hypothetical protein
MRASKVRLALVTAVVALVLAAVEARAGDVALRAGAYTDVDRAFVGIEYRTPLQGRLAVAPNFELVFPGEGSYFSFSADLHYLFAAQGKLSPWLGGGLGIYSRHHGGGGSDTTAGANFIAGLALRTDLHPHVQLKVVVKGDTSVVLGFGIRF